MRKTLIGLAVSTAMLGACGGGGGSSDTDAGGEVSGLDMPTAMSVVAPSGDPSAVAGLKTNFRGVARALYDQAGSDYSKDPSRTHVYDPSIEPLESVNMILCLLEQTAAGEMVNKGAYAALVNETKCEQGEEPSSDTGQSSAANVSTYNRWIIHSSREDNSSPQLVKIWIGQDGAEHDQQNIMVEVTVNEGVSDAKPFGDFEMVFKGLDANGAEKMTGTLKTVDAAAGEANFVFFESGTRTEEFGPMGAINVANSSAANVKFHSASGSEGTAHTALTRVYSNDLGQTAEESSTFRVAFNGTHMLRDGEATQSADFGHLFDGGSAAEQLDACSSRTDFKTSVWRYNLYYSDSATTGSPGARVELNAGFPFKASVAGKDVWGFVGYWGMGLPQGIDASSITQITRMDGSGANNEIYDVVAAPGKLIKSTRSTLNLNELAGVTFDYWDAGESYVVEYTGGQWVKTHRWSSDHQSYNDEGASLGAITLSTGQWLNMWSQQLGGQVNFVPGDTKITFYKQEFVNNSTAIDALFGAQHSVRFKCYNNCLKPGATAEDINDGSAFYAASFNADTPAVTYGFDKETLALYVDLDDDHMPDAGELVQWPSSGTVRGQYSWGINAGDFVMNSVALNDVSEMFSQEVTYRWETGPNHWNKTYTVKASGTSDFVAFDPPLHITYTFAEADDANAGMAEDGSSYYGQTFLLDYGGIGNLRGIPGDKSGRRWEPAFALKDGTELGGEYVVKGVEKEQRMNELDGVTACTDQGLSVASVGELPDGGDVGTITIAWAGKPSVTAAPAVVEGVVQ